MHQHLLSHAVSPDPPVGILPKESLGMISMAVILPCRMYINHRFQCLTVQVVWLLSAGPPSVCVVVLPERERRAYQRDG